MIFGKGLCRQPHTTGISQAFFAQSPDMIVKRADGNPVLYAPLAVSKATGPALCDQFQPLLIV